MGAYFNLFILLVILFSIITFIVSISTQYLLKRRFLKDERKYRNFKTRREQTIDGIREGVNRTFTPRNNEPTTPISISGDQGISEPTVNPPRETSEGPREGSGNLFFLNNSKSS